MAEYTMELGELVNAGYRIPLDNYPIFDERYRPVLNDKIIDHYFTREICCPEPQRFSRYLERRMNEIMPYYNQLYVSAMKEFDPFETVSIVSKAKHKDSESARRVTNTGEQTANTNESAESHHTESGSREDENNALTDKFGKVDTRSVTKDNTDNTDTTEKTTGSETFDETTTNALKDKTHITETDNLRETTTDNQNYWDLPQTYQSGTDSNGNPIYSNGAPTTATNNSGSKTNNNTIDRDETTDHTGTVVVDRDIATTESKTGNRKTVGKETTADTNTESGETTHTNKRDTTGSANESYNGKVNTKDIGSRVGTAETSDEHEIAHEEETSKHGREMFSPSKLLKEWRSTFLNIDMLVIDELENLFMGVF